MSSRSRLCSPTLSSSYSHSSSSFTDDTNAAASAFNCFSFATSGRTSVAYDDNAPDTVSNSSANPSALSFTGFVVAKSCSASGAV
ncbi:hypothetical protein [Streptomyces sp. NPDC003456]|uniref:hypothetical protein n=1 Tax=Streptomyces sp. NPDC003456 TaxID=3364683 RepID=UPI0036953F1B